MVDVDTTAKTVQIESELKKTCLQASEPLEYGDIHMMQCDKTNPLQQWIINSPNKYYIQNVANKSLCLTAIYYPIPNCTQSPYNGYPYCNPNLPVDQRVNDLVSRMTMEEKISNLQNKNNGIARLGIPPNKFNEALHGVCVSCGEIYNNNTGCPTSFPHALLMSASFNRSLWKHVAITISDEARALHNQNIAGLFYWVCCVFVLDLC